MDSEDTERTSNTIPGGGREGGEGRGDAAAPSIGGKCWREGSGEGRKGRREVERDGRGVSSKMADHGRRASKVRSHDQRVTT